MSSKKTLVIGASPKSWRYSYAAVERLRQYGHEVVALGKSAGKIGDVSIIAEWPEHLEDIDTVTLYLRAELQDLYREKILSLKPRRIIFNPGAENGELYHQAAASEIEVTNACTLVLLATSQY